MPATKITFADYRKHPRPGRVYVDTNFAVNLLYYELNKSRPSSIRTKDLNCYQFYNVLTADGVEIVGSIYTFSETLQTYCFTYPGGMYDLAEAYFRSHGITVSGSRHEKFKQFVNRYTMDCEQAWRSISYRVGATEEFFDIYGIKLLHPLPSPALTNITRSVVNYAAILMDYFAAIESTDSCHLSVASYINSDAVISLDSGFLTVDGFTIYCLS